MIVKYMTPEAEENHAEYSLTGNMLTISDMLTINLEKYECDDDFHMDICGSATGVLTMGVIPGWSTSFVAQIDIPARTYHEEDLGQVDEHGSQVLEQVADPYDPEKTTLTLWEEV